MQIHFTYEECVSLSIFIGRLVPNPHMICSLDNGTFMLFGEFRNYQVSLFFTQGTMQVLN